MSRFIRSPWLLAVALLCAAAPIARSQVLVRLELPRRLFISYEPVLATVTITNMTGSDLTLEDNGAEKWFSFDIMGAENLPVPPREVHYHNPPLTIPIGQSVTRKVNLVALYPISDYGVYRVRAVIYVAGMEKYFSSSALPIEISDGQTLWEQTVGIPAGQTGAGGEYRHYQLLSFQQTKENTLYVRIEDTDKGVVYCTYPLGRLVDGYEPDVAVDALSQLHILEMVSPKEYVYTRLDPNANVLGQDDYADLKTRPHLKRTENGDVVVTGGSQIQPQQGSPTPTGPKLSERPAGLPGE